MDRGDLAAPEPPRECEGVAGDAQAGALGHDLDALDHTSRDAVFEPRVEVFGVLADEDQVDALEARGDPGQRAHRPDAGVQVEGLAQGDVGGAEALADGRRDRSLERHPAAADRLEHRLRHGGSVLGDHLAAGLDAIPFDCDTGRFEDPDCGLGDLGADTVTRQ